MIMPPASPTHVTVTFYRPEDAVSISACSTVTTTFLQFVNLFLEKGGNPDLTFSALHIGNSSFEHITFFQAVYLFWKALGTSELYSENVNASFTHVIDHMLNDQRTNVRETFTEQTLGTRTRTYLLEGATIAHYAMVIGDLQMVKNVLRKAPDLIDTTCSALLNRVTRITRVSLLHLAAIQGNKAAARYFEDRANFMVHDSNQFTPLQYLDFAISNSLIQKKASTIAKLRTLFTPTTRPERAILPDTSLLLQRKGYWVRYDTRTRLLSFAYERLTALSVQGLATRDGLSFRIDRQVPQENRATSTDYNGSGFDIGHQAAGSNHTSSEEVMRDTFLFTNACPQDPGLNRGYWKTFEGKIRQLAFSYDLIEVFTGPLFAPQNNAVSYRTIGKGQIPVPTHFFKVLYFHKGKEPMIERAYVFPNEPIAPSTNEGFFSKTVTDVQRLSGILFNQWRG